MFQLGRWTQPLVGQRNGKRRVPARSAGFSMIEMLTLVSLAGLLLSTSAMVLNLAFRAHERTLVQFRQLEQLNRWHDRFVDDVHLAHVAEIGVGKAVLRRRDGSSAEYALAGNQLQRTYSSEPLGDPATAVVETWQASPLASADWTLTGQPPSSLLTVELHFAPSTQRLEPVVWSALVGRSKTERMGDP